MSKEIDAIRPEWLGEIISGKRNSMTQEEKKSLDNLVVTIESVSGREAFEVYNKLMNYRFSIDESKFKGKLKDVKTVYVGPDSAQFCIAFKVCVTNNIA